MKQLRWTRLILTLCILTSVIAPRGAKAESQGSDYKGVTDPFGDPQNYEFAEDEKEDKEWFHLGRFLMLSLDGGGGIFTGGLGTTVNPGFYVGARLTYFFDRSLAMEAGVHYANHLDTIEPSANERTDIDTNLVPLTLGLRYSFDVRGAPKAIAVANPYIIVGGGLYLRTQKVIDQINFPVTLTGTGSTQNFGAFAGAGFEFSIYKRHLFLDLDARYNFIFWTDANQTYNGAVNEGTRNGGYFCPSIGLTYSF